MTIEEIQERIEELEEFLSSFNAESQEGMSEDVIDELSFMFDDAVHELCRLNEKINQLMPEKVLDADYSIPEDDLPF